MAKEESTRKVTARLKAAGFTSLRTNGSHTVWTNGSVSVSVPDGHKTISAGVVRQVDAAIGKAAK